MPARRYEISDEQWEQIKDMFPKAKTGRPPKDNRLMFNAILWFAISGAAWQIFRSATILTRQYFIYLGACSV